MEASAARRLWQYTVGRRVPVAVVLCAVLFLNSLGLLMLFSIGRATEAGMGGYFFRQCLWVGIALTGFCAALFFKPSWIRHLAWPAAAAVLVLLVIVLIPGIGLKINGARRWLDIGPMNLQVSDVAKIGYLLLLADYFARVRRHRETLVKGFLLPLTIIGTFSLLIILQPDFGTAFLFCVVGGTLLFLAGCPVKFLFPTGALGLVLFALAVWQDPVRLRRILAFLDVEGNRADGTYQLWQGIIGFAFGGVNGVGLGNSRQQFSFLPEAHTDFIFPIIGEELGLIFTLLVASAFALCFVVTWGQLGKAPGIRPFILVAGALLFVTLQALINMGVATGILPTKGMSLPFISYGGSNLVVTYFLFGIICRHLWEWNEPPRLRPGEVSET